MTTEKQSENTAVPAESDNKAVFAPLGKYAIVAVIMVSIIVTTAIMLNKQLSDVDEHLAMIENEVAEMNIAAGTDTPAAETTADLAPAEPTSVANTESKEAVVTETAKTETAPIAEITEAPVAEMTETPAAEVLVAQETATAPVVAEQEETAVASQFEMTTSESPAKLRHEQLVKENQARIDAHKAEQKQHISEMFARIKALEAQQLDRYRAGQDAQITRLREQLAQQQQMIEALVIRNKDLFELRAANVQKNQSKREEALNRI